MAPSTSCSSTKAVKKRKRPKREVLVVECPTDVFEDTKPSSTSATAVVANSRHGKKNATGPASSVSDTRTGETKNSTSRQDDAVLDWHTAAKEVRALGTTGLGRRDQRKYQEKEYERLTGRQQKGQKMPLPLVRKLRASRQQKEDYRIAAAKEAGVVLAKTSNTNDDNKRQYKRGHSKRNHLYGPAPSIGFMKDGVYRVSKSERRGDNGR